MYTCVVCILYSCYLHSRIHYTVYTAPMLYTLYSCYIYTILILFICIYRFLSGYVAGAGPLQQCGAAAEARGEPKNAGAYSV